MIENHGLEMIDGIPNSLSESIEISVCLESIPGPKSMGVRASEIDNSSLSSEPVALSQLLQPRGVGRSLIMLGD